MASASAAEVGPQGLKGRGLQTACGAVADAIDVARNSPTPGPDSLDIKVTLLTPNVARECVPLPVRAIPMKHTFR